jgi:hypothetical protein
MSIKRIPVEPDLVAPPLSAVGTPRPAGATRAADAGLHRRLNSEDGTSQLLTSGFWTLAAGSLFALLTLTVFGGMGPQGPHTNMGWLSLMISMMSTPFGLLLLLLGAAKWLRNLRLSRLPQLPRQRG